MDSENGGPNPAEEIEVRRLANFRMSDGSPAYAEWQRPAEPTAAFVQRMAKEVANGAGYVSLASVELHVITDDPETESLIRQTLENKND